MRTMKELRGMINEHLRSVGPDFKKYFDSVDELIEEFKKKITPEELELIRGRKERYKILENTVGTEQWKLKQMSNEIDELRLKYPVKSKERSDKIDAIIEKWNVDTTDITYV
jgi:DNA repair ATPase RecN